MSVTTRITDDDIGRGSGHGAVLPLGLSPDDVNCPICVETISDPFVTSCGHTFCYQCISTQLKHKNSCPSCGDYLTADNIYPNFLLNKILRKAATAPPSGRGSLLDQFQRLLADNLAPDPPALGSCHPPLHLNAQPHPCSNSQHLHQQGQAQRQAQRSPITQHHHEQQQHSSRGAAAGGGGTVAALTPTAAPSPLRGGGGGGGAAAAAAAAATASGGRCDGRLRLRLRDIDAVLEALYEAREELERRESSDALHLLLCFLQHAREHKARQMAGLRQQLACLEYDILSVTASAAAAATPAAANTDCCTAPEALRQEVGPALGSAAAAAMAAAAVAATAASPPPQVPPHRGGGPVSSIRSQHPQLSAAIGPSGPSWFRRTLPHLGPGDAEGRGGSTAVAAAADQSDPRRMVEPPLPLPPTSLSQDYSPRHLYSPPCGLRPDQDPDQQQQRQRQLAHRAPLRRASWCLHTITPTGRISSVTVDTSSLDEPGQQAEAFGAAVQHALAAATGGGGGAAAAGAAASTSVGRSIGDGNDGSGRGEVRRPQPPPQTTDWDEDMDSVGQLPPSTAAAAIGFGAAAIDAVSAPGGAAPAVAAAAATVEVEDPESDAAVAVMAGVAPSAASMPSGSETEAPGGVGAAATGTTAGGSVSATAADMAQRCDASGGGDGGPYGTLAVAAGRRVVPRCGSADNFMLLAGQAEATEAAASLPSASGDVASGGGGGEDCSAASGAEFPPPAAVAAGSPGPGHQQLQPLLTIAAERTSAAVIITSPLGTGHGIPSASAQQQSSRRGASEEEPNGAGTEREEDEMDVRERRRGRGRLPPQPPPQPQRPQQPLQQHRIGFADGGGRDGSSPCGGSSSGTARDGSNDPRVIVVGAGKLRELGPAAAAAGARGRGEGLAVAGGQAQAVVSEVLEGQQRGPVVATKGEEEEEEEGVAAVHAAKRQRMLSQFELLERCYLQMRAARTWGSGGTLRHQLQPPEPDRTTNNLHLAVAAAAAAAPATATAAPAAAATSPPTAWTRVLAAGSHPQPQSHHPPHRRTSPQPISQTPIPLTLQREAVHLEAAGGHPAVSPEATVAPLRNPIPTHPRGCAHPHEGASASRGRCNCGSGGDHGDHGGGGGNDPDLEIFGAVLAAATRHSRLELLAEIPRHGSESGRTGFGSAVGHPQAGVGAGGGGLQILSSIEFDLSDDLFATAGVVPRILVYDYQALLSRQQQPPRPVTELTARSKLSCLSYSRGVRQHLLAADYQGGVAFWDTEAGMQVHGYEAHERRVWGVDFCPDPANHHCFASGSDDGLVKVWSTRQPGSCLALELRGNVCSVEFHPREPNLLAVGSALHCAAVYDLRQPAAPLYTLLGHRRAVSYVRWLSSRYDLVTASTDSTLKLWSLSPPPPPPSASASPPPHSALTTCPCSPGRPSAEPATATAAANAGLTWPCAAPPAAAAASWPPASTFHCAQLVRTFSGHLNERSFVGLTTDGDYLACGSESHEVFVYHRSLPQPALRFSFVSRMQELERSGVGTPHHPQQQQSRQTPQTPQHHFVTALQWRRNSPHLLAANSAGYVWLLGLKL